MAEPASLRDRLGRPPGVLRLSLTARCNLACPYCCPDSQEPPELLSLTERLQLVAAAVDLGFGTLRLTGGEPLLNRDLEALIGGLQALRDPSSRPRGPLQDIALTTNGALLGAERARALKAAGLDRITISLDGTDGESVARMAGLLAGPSAGEALLAKVLAAVEHARAAGFDPAAGQLKLNAVIARGRNDDQLLPLAALARRLGVELRLIEFMDVGNRNGWNLEQVVPAAEMLQRIGAVWPLQPVGRASAATANRWRYRDGGLEAASGGGQLAVVASISAPFCGDCNRLRITADGVAYTCLFASSGFDLKPWLRPGGRPGADRAGLDAALRGLWRERQDRYSEERGPEAGSAEPSTPAAAHAEMAYLGG
ncbi:radical SAM protein [Synechococcus sp. CS-602]|uniref:GTP 3',8-cyclase MoaA n=1 Tax=Synechococcaceae TaxID=1890426 RepID=UPI0008FF4C73|nr:MULTISPECIES: radical SAM protein [Synechococcaceae]MCT4365027.1 radical SAM protein [Candidatus Regnicoccus frigidus MAG-AL1]APD49371.1 cyclic pyranopterin phosphate synthase MoaA [Synechococcus sp. SynAce01]MCT0202995.1 radical SAM protein [Synechococcus sp. CS-603]MCT0204634.1 radical SAM protein [Synechococcus sp. CS-602]MCT0245255.1 radical SAM protein [Synechococcus sp. CS-601]